MKKPQKKLLLSLKDDIYLWLVLGLGFLLRVWGIGFGLPHLYQADEGKLLYTVFFAAGNGLRPDTFIHSILIAYLLIPFYGLYFVMGRVLGVFSSGFDFYVTFLKDPTVFLLIARLLMVLVSLGGVVVVYLVGKRFHSKNVGILASFFLSFSFLVVKESHYYKDEVLASLLVSVFMYFVLLSLERLRSRDFYLASVFLGLVVSAKYIYMPVGMVLLVVMFMVKVSKRLIISGILLSMAVYLFTNPYILLNLGEFINQTREIFVSSRGIGTARLFGRPAWLNFLVLHLPKGLGWSFYLLSVLAMMLSLFGKLDRKASLIGVAVLMIFVGILLGGGNFDRWAVPMVPMFSLLAAVLMSRIGLKGVWLGVVSSLVIFPSLVRIVKFNQVLTWSDTRTRAKEWVEETIPSGATIIIEGSLSDEVTSYLGPPLVLEEKRLKERLESNIERGLRGVNLQAKIQAYSGSVAYDLVAVSRVGFNGTDGFAKYEERGVEYLITSNWARQGREESVHDFIASEVELVKQFEPSVVFRYDALALGMDYEALDSVKLLEDGVFGPVISVYKFL